jgi:membrane associated rhomboid family serine protease
MLNIKEPAPLILAVILVLCHLGFVLAPDGLKETIYSATVLAARDGNVFLTGRPIGNFATLITHTLAHGDWTHVLMNAGFILAFGVITIRATKNAQTPIFNRIKRGPFVFLRIFLAGAVLGGLGQWAIWVFSNGSGAALGASTGGAALFACAGWALGGKERMIGFIVVMMAIDAFIIFTGGVSSGLHNPAWAGHLGGFIAGAILAPRLLEPNSVQLSNFR